MHPADSWVTPLWTTVAGGVLVVVFQRSYRGIGKWQEGRKDVDAKDHELLHEIADVMMDKPASAFGKGSKGLVTRFGDMDNKVDAIAETVETILAKMP